jgi:hypothetical protein
MKSDEKIAASVSGSYSSTTYTMVNKFLHAGLLLDQKKKTPQSNAKCSLKRNWC